MMIEKKFVLIGGGIGSFCFYNCLRIHGVPADDIAVISRHQKPYHQLKAYCDSIGLTKNERLRSDSGSRPDNFWGFPGYGLTESLKLLRKKRLIRSAKTILQLFTEPLIFGYYSPSAGQVYSSIDKEARRIGWANSLILGEALQLIKLPDDRYKIRLKSSTKVVELKAQYVHLSLGHGNVNTVRNGKQNIINAYNLTKKTIAKIKKTGGTVLVIGRGTTAAKVVERLLSLKSDKKIKVISLHRNELSREKDIRGLMQKTFRSWRLQQFNWPKSAFGSNLLELSQENIKDPLWSSPTAAPDKKWLSLINKSIENGRYKVVTKPIKADFTINCTGFDENVKNNSFYTSLIKKYRLPVNSSQAFMTGKNFELPKLCGYKSRVFVSGIAAAGNYYGPVDSFLGHQYAALKAVEAIPEINTLGAQESAAGWLKWIRNKKI